MIFVRRPRSSERLFGIRVLASVYLSSRSFSGSSECSLISLHSPSSWDACLLRAKHAVAAAAAAVGLLFGTEHRWIEALSAPRPSVRPVFSSSVPVLSRRPSYSIPRAKKKLWGGEAWRRRARTESGEGARGPRSSPLHRCGRT